MDVWIMNGQTDRWMDNQMDRLIDGWIMNGQTDRWMDNQMDIYLLISHLI